MPIEGGTVGILEGINMALGIKISLLLFLVFNTVFAIVLYRQIQLMGRTIDTPVVSYLRFIAILYIGVSLGILFIVGGSF